MPESLSKDDYAKLIGRVIVEFSLLEYILELEIWYMLCADKPACQRVTAGLSLMDLAKLFRSLFIYRVKDVTLRKRCQKIYERIESINQKRNEAIHSKWVIGYPVNNPSKLLASRAKPTIRHEKGFRNKVETNQVKLLVDTGRDIKNVFSDLYTLVGKTRIIVEAHRIENLNCSLEDLDRDGYPI